MDHTALLNLPYIMPSQAQKHVTHNEALRMLDAILHIRVEDRGRNDPPADPVEGQRHVVGEEPAGAFAGHAGAIAAFQDGAWSFHQPRAGWMVWDAAEAALLVFDGHAWKLVFDPQDVPLLGVNTDADTTNRLAVRADATLLTHDGAGHQLKLNKAAAGDTGSLLFQTAWSGRAEMGLAGNDDFSVKVSPDGSTWVTALTVNRVTGRLGAGVTAPQAVLHAKAATNGQNLFLLDDAGDSNLWRIRFDGSALHNYLSRQTVFNLSDGLGMDVIGGTGLRCETLRVHTQASDHATGSKSLRIGETGSGYATATQTLTRPNMAFRSWAWNGTNGFSLSTPGWFGLEQTAAANNQAKFFWRTGSFSNPNRMALDQNGNLDVAGSLSAAAFAKVGSYTVGTVPSASTAGAGAIIYVSDEADGATLAFSDGTSWCRVTDRAVVS